jgi:hypothetical protein
VLAQRIIPELESAGELELNHDSSTNTLIRRYRARRVRTSEIVFRRFSTIEL